MNAFEIPFALFAFLGLVAVMPVWLYFTTSHSALNALGPASTFLVQLVVPATAALFIGGWLQPG